MDDLDRNIEKFKKDNPDLAKDFDLGYQDFKIGAILKMAREEKGLTQEELVEKCNLSVRTLQRIEYGEVTPRTYTVKLIFEALDLNYENSFVSEKGMISKWLEQFFISFIDLFIFFVCFRS